MRVGSRRTVRLARLTGRHKPRDADTKIHIKDHISNKMIKILLVKGFSRDASICEVKSAGNSDGKHQLGTALELCLLLRKKFGFAWTILVVLAKLAQRIYLFCGLSVSRKKRQIKTDDTLCTMILSLLFLRF